MRECLDSVLNQPFGDWEALIGVETSKDKTEEIVREYATKDPRFKVFTGPRSGSCSASRNTGIDMAQGEYVIFLDGDDTIAEGSLQRLYDKIAARPGADLYPCAIQVHNDITGKAEELRDNYPSDSPAELTGVKASLLLYSRWLNPSPMLQFTVFRHGFLIAHGLKCIHGLRNQDSEFSPRALYFAKRVVPLHEPYYLYRIRASSVQTAASGRGRGYFYKDWSVILRSLFAFHAAVSSEAGFDKRLAACWAHAWTSLLTIKWFSKDFVNKVPRQERLKSLSAMFADGFSDFDALMKAATLPKRVAGWWVKSFVRRPSTRWLSERFFVWIYFPMTRLKGGK